MSQKQAGKHYGIANKLHRREKTVEDLAGAVIFQGASLRQARRFMRTGNPGAAPKKPKQCTRGEGQYCPAPNYMKAYAASRSMRIKGSG